MLSPKQTLLRNAEYQRVYQDLFSICEENLTSTPFLPLIPNDWGIGKGNKIIWSGAATNSWHEGNHPKKFDLICEDKKNEKWIEENLSKNYNRSQFWRIRKACLDELNESWNSTIWSNVLKIGGIRNVARGMPLKKLKKDQRELCVRAFKLELEILKPDLVVLHVGELVNYLRHEIYGPWNNETLYVPKGGKGLAAYTIYEGTKIIWMSRRSRSDADYLLAFLHCLKGLEWER